MSVQVCAVQTSPSEVKVEYLRDTPTVMTLKTDIHVRALKCCKVWCVPVVHVPTGRTHALSVTAPSVVCLFLSFPPSLSPSLPLSLCVYPQDFVALWGGGRMVVYNIIPDKESIMTVGGSDMCRMQ